MKTNALTESTVPYNFEKGEGHTTAQPKNNNHLIKGSRKKSYLFLVAAATKRGGGKGRATKNKTFFWKLEKKIRKNVATKL